MHSNCILDSISLKKIHLCNFDVKIQWNRSPVQCGLGKWCDRAKKRINFPFSIVNSFNIIQRCLVHMSEFYSIFFALRFTVLPFASMWNSQRCIRYIWLQWLLDCRCLMMMAMHLMFAVHFQFTSKFEVCRLFDFAVKLMPEPVNRHFWPCIIYGADRRKETVDFHSTRKTVAFDWAYKHIRRNDEYAGLHTPSPAPVKCRPTKIADNVPQIW